MSYMISAWARICKILGPAFSPYLPVVMGPIMKTASMKPEVALLDNDELNGVENDSEDWQFVSLGEQQNLALKRQVKKLWNLTKIIGQPQFPIQILYFISRQNCSSDYLLHKLFFRA